MKKIATVTLFLFSLLPTGFSQSLDDYLKVAAENNPELKAYFSDYLAAMERVPQVGTLPDPELRIGFFIQPMERFMGNQHADVQLMQMFPWFGMLRTRKDEASNTALARFEVFRNAKNQLFYQVKNTWYELHRLEKEIHLTEESLAILKRYERLALTRFQNAGTESPGATTGNASGMSDVLRVRLEVKELENTLALLIDSRKPLQAAFNQLLNRNPDENIAVADSLSDVALPPERRVLPDSIIRHHPMLKRLEAEEKAYQAQQEMAKLEGRPVLGAGVNYMPFSPRTEDGMTMGGHDMVMPMVRMTLPIYRKKYNALQKEMDLKQQAVQQRKKNTVNELSTAWSTTRRDLDDAIRRATLYRGQTALARQTLNLLMTSYATHGRDFEEVLRVQQQLLEYRLGLVTAIVDQHTAVAMLETLAATALP